MRGPSLKINVAGVNCTLNRTSYVFHNPKPASDEQKLSAFDIVLQSAYILATKFN